VVARLLVGWCRLILSNPRSKRLELSANHVEPLSKFALSFNLCRYILDAGADVNKAREDAGATPLFIAAQNGKGRASLPE
jgi:ankyrin repeat protein